MNYLDSKVWKGWDDLFQSVLEFTILPHENKKEIIAGSLILGMQRADLLKRKFDPRVDIPHVLSPFCWWPFKPSFVNLNREYLYKHRYDLFDGVSISKRAQERLLEAIPEEVLKINTDELYNLINHQPIEKIIRFEKKY